MNLPFGGDLRSSEQAIDSGAQTERRGRAPVCFCLPARTHRPIVVPFTNCCLTRYDAGRASDSLFVHLPGVLEPSLVRGCLLPAFVGCAWTDQVDVGAEVLAIVTGAIAGTIGPQAEIVGS